MYHRPRQPSRPRSPGQAPPRSRVPFIGHVGAGRLPNMQGANRNFSLTLDTRHLAPYTSVMSETEAEFVDTPVKAVVTPYINVRIPLDQKVYLEEWAKENRWQAGKLARILIADQIVARAARVQGELPASLVADPPGERWK